MLDPAARAALEPALAEGRRIGAIGQVPPGAHLDQAFGYLAAGLVPEHATVLDLGSGGGLPALPLALVRPDTRWILVEAWVRRADLLRRLVRTLGLADRVEVVAARAEDVGRGPWRGRVDVVTARAFAPPPVTVECAAPLLRVGGVLVCSIRDDEPAWPADVLAGLGLGGCRDWHVGRFAYRACTQEAPAPAAAPRRAGVPERRPLF